MHFSTNIKYFHVIDELLACLQLELIPNYLFSNCKKKKICAHVGRPACIGRVMLNGSAEHFE